MTAKDSELSKVIEVLSQLIEDTSVPRNVRASIASAKQKLESMDDPATSISSAIYALDEVSNDINLPMHARTLVWNLLSELEVIKEKHLR
ncbi:MAG: UPF0147 family protein [Candidatus Micrarchaeia archaeon]|jgi:uncharacterized protein (UPF0147 family)